MIFVFLKRFLFYRRFDILNLMNLRDSLNRICIVLLAAILFSLAMPEVSFAAEKPVLNLGMSTACCEQKEHKSSEAVICSIQPAPLPYASDETDQGRTYINAGSGGRLQRGFSLRRCAWLFSTISEYRLSFTREICSQRVTADSFDDLFIIHFIHNQDGQKGWYLRFLKPGIPGLFRVKKRRNEVSKWKPY